MGSDSMSANSTAINCEPPLRVLQVRVLQGCCSTSAPTHDAAPEPRANIRTQLLYPVTTDDTRSVQPVTGAQIPVVLYEEKQE